MSGDSAKVRMVSPGHLTETTSGPHGSASCDHMHVITRSP